MRKGYSVRINQKIINDVTSVDPSLAGCTNGHKVEYVLDGIFKDFFIDNKKHSIDEEISKKTKDISPEMIVTFRCEPEVMKRLRKYFKAKNNTETVKLCLTLFVKSKQQQQPKQQQSGTTALGKLSDHEYLVSRPGAKKEDVLKLILNAIIDITNKKKISVYAEPFMGTANVHAHLPEPLASCVKTYLNDAEPQIVNLFKVLQKYPDEFIKALPSEVNEEIFDDIKNIRDKIELPTRNKKDQIASAVTFYYTLLLSVRGKGENLRDKATPQTVNNKINIISKVAKLLKNVSISKNDWEYFLKKIMKDHENEHEKFLIYADPPYIFTEDTYTASKKGFNHEKFGKKLLSYDPERVTFLLSYRSTISEGEKKQHNLTDKDVQKVLDDIYCNQGLYIAFEWAKTIKKKTQVEVLISNFNFTGSVAYDKNIDELMESKGFMPLCQD